MSTSQNRHICEQHRDELEPRYLLDQKKMDLCSSSPRQNQTVALMQWWAVKYGWGCRWRYKWNLQNHTSYKEWYRNRQDRACISYAWYVSFIYIIGSYLNTPADKNDACGENVYACCIYNMFWMNILLYYHNKIYFELIYHVLMALFACLRL